MRTKTLLASGIAALLTVGSALAQQPAQPAAPQPFRVGTPLGTTNEAGQQKTMSSNVKVYGSFHFAESCTYDPDRNLILAMNAANPREMGGPPPPLAPNDGFVSLINPDGSVHTSKWIGVTRDGLTLVHPLGSAIQGGTLYVNDGNFIRTFDLRAGTPKQAFEVREAANLNGIGVAADGTMYASNTGNPQRIYKVTPSGQSSVFIDGAPLAQPNGVAIDPQGNIVVVNIGNNEVLTFDTAGKLVKTEHAKEAGNDGLVILPNGTKYVSSVRFGSVSKIEPGKEAEVIAEGIPAAASMCYDSRQNQLVIPMNPNNALAFIPLGRRRNPVALQASAAAAIAAATLLQPLSAAAQSGGCDRACLEALLDAYVEAVVAHDARRLPFASEPKFTENGQRLTLDDGLWHTATGKGGYALKLADVERGQAVLMGTIREADTPTVLVARLGVAERRIAELETLVIRDREVADRLDTIGTPRAVWSQPVAAGDRRSRGELVAIANRYFSGIERNDGRDDYPLAADCARLENGLVLAGDVALVSPRAQGRPNGPQVGCLEQFESGIFFYVTRIRDRRFVLVDTERSLVFAFAFFDNAGGESRFGTLPDGRRVESGPKIPWTWAIAEVFKIERGLIGPVESVLHQVPYGMGSGWSTWEESLSSEPRG